jgi:hypothetical protein
MKTNPLKESALTENSTGIGTVTRDMVHSRASELAFIVGHPPNGATMSDLAQASGDGGQIDGSDRFGI